MAQGRLVFDLFAYLAEFERELIRERTHAGLASARARGRVGGRQRGLSEEAERMGIIAKPLCRKQQLGINEIAQRLRISKVTLYKYLRHRKVGVVKQVGQNLQLTTCIFKHAKRLAKMKKGDLIPFGKYYSVRSMAKAGKK